MKFKMRTLLTAPAVLLMLASTGAGTVSANQQTRSQRNEISRNVLSQTANKVGGYGSHAKGGSKLAAKAVSVKSLSGLRKVLKKANGKPITVIIRGHLDGNYDEKTGKTLTAKDYAKGTGYSLNKYLKAYNPKTYGKKEPAGVQENARKIAQKRQEKQITVNVPSNVTLYGAPGSLIKNVNFKLSGHSDILRNLNLRAPVDYFPGWDPKDGKSGNWNSQYDAISDRGARQTWIDNVFASDGQNKDHNPSAKTYGRQYQQHDGLIDITNKADQATVSNSRLANHDKAMLIGNSDKRTSDAGHLHVSLLHDQFDNVSQRAPRVRYGHVQIKNSTFNTNDRLPYRFGYVWKQGKHAKITASNDAVWDKKQSKIKNTLKPSKANQKLAKKAFNFNGADLTDHDSYTHAKNIIVNGQHYNVNINGKASLKPTLAHHNRKATNKKIKKSRKNKRISAKKIRRQKAHNRKLARHEKRQKAILQRRINRAKRLMKRKNRNRKSMQILEKRIQKAAAQMRAMK